MLLEGKKLLITGVLTPQSIAFAAAKSAQEQGAEIVLTNFGRTVSLTQKTAKRLPTTPDVLEMDANSDEQIAAVCGEVRRRWGKAGRSCRSISTRPSRGPSTTGWASRRRGSKPSRGTSHAISVRRGSGSTP